MKRTITLRFLLSLCVLTLCSFLDRGGNIACAEEVTVEYSSLINDFSMSDPIYGKSFTKDNITISFALGTGTRYPETYGTYLKIYGGNEMTVSTANGAAIKSITFSYTNTTYFNIASEGTISGTSWTGNTNSVTFSHNLGSTKNARPKGIKITYVTASKELLNPTLAFETSSVEIDLLDSYQVQANVSAPSADAPIPAGSISYSVIEDASNDYTFEGTLFTAGKTPGKYTIVAKYSESSDVKVYNEATDTCEIYVKSLSVSSPKNYYLVTDKSQLVDGGQYILVYDDGSTYYIMGAYKGSPDCYAEIAAHSHYYFSYGDGINSSVESDAMPFVLEDKGDGIYTLKTAKGYLQCYVMDNGETITTGYGLMLSPSTYSQATHWAISVDENGNAHIVNDYDNTLALMYTSGKFQGYKYEYYGTSCPAVKLYAKCAEMPIKQEALGYGTYAVDFAYLMPKGVKGYAIDAVKDGVEDEAKKLVKTEAYAEETAVPMLTPLLVYSEEAAAASKTYYPIVIYKDVDDYTGDNYLEYKRNGGMTASKKGESVYYYKLTQKVDSENPENSKPLGFYWGADKGAAFTLNNASSAYLALPQSLFNNVSQASALLFDEGGQATGIQLTTTTENNTQAVYNLQGVRVSGKLAKGIYIVNGKKVLVK